MASSLRGNGSLCRLQYAEEQSSRLLPRNRLRKNRKSFLNLNQSRPEKGIAIVANCADGNIMNLPSKAPLFPHDVDTERNSGRFKSSTDVKPNKKIQDKQGEIVAEELDRWVKDSAVEIVSNLDEAPFLVHVYSNNSDTSTSRRGIKLIREKAISDDWPFIKKRWEGENSTPNGVILVEELCNQEPGLESERDKETFGISNQSTSSSTKSWGVLIQGKGRNCTACYLLKTCQVQSEGGFCTHFGLVRVDCFVEHADVLLKKMWLQG